MLKDTVSAFTPRSGLVYHVANGVSLYASYSRSFNPPVLNQGAISLEPTRARQWEGGVKFDLFGSQVQGNSAAFWITKYGLPGGVAQAAQRAGIQRSQGAEFDVSLRPRRLGVEVQGAYSFTDGDSTESGTTRLLVNAPRHSGSVWAFYESPAIQRWRIGAGIQHVGERRINVLTDFTAPAYSRLDAMATRSIGPHWRIQLNARNLTNSRYYETDGLFGFLLPASPRAVDVGLRFGF